jgi:ATP phosphoribosyltransferase
MENNNNGNLKLAIQKKGRLTEKSLELLKLCGIDIENYSERLVVSSQNFPIDLLFLRDDDIPEYVQDGVADIGIVGENVVREKEAQIEVLEKLGFGKCKIMMAHPQNIPLNDIKDLNHKTIATSYPKILREYLQTNGLNSKIIELSGSVEIAPSLGVADFICDIVSTGNTLMMNKLKKGFAIFESQAVLISAEKTIKDQEKSAIISDLVRRIRSVQSARRSRYLMMNVPKEALSKIMHILPSLRSPTVVPLADETLVAVHAVIPADYIWSIVDVLKQEFCYYQLRI